MLLERGVGLSSTSDSEVITQMLAAPPEVWAGTGNNGAHVAEESLPKKTPSEVSAPDAGADRWAARIRAFMQIAEGAFCLTILTRDAIYAARDPQGLRPLCLGEVEGGYVVASESCALQTIGAHYIREVNPGEIIRLDRSGITSFEGRKQGQRA